MKKSDGLFVWLYNKGNFDDREIHYYIKYLLIYIYIKENCSCLFEALYKVCKYGGENGDGHK